MNVQDKPSAARKSAGIIRKRPGIPALDGRMRGWIVAAVVLITFPSLAHAQVCPSPAVANNTFCTVPAGTVINVAPANAVGLRSIGSLGSIAADSITINLAATGTRGAFADTGSRITLDNSSTTGSLANQRGFYALGTGTSIFASNSTITLTGNNSPGSGQTAARSFSTMLRYRRPEEPRLPAFWFFGRPGTGS